MRVGWAACLKETTASFYFAARKCLKATWKTGAGRQMNSSLVFESVTLA